MSYGTLISNKLFVFEVFEHVRTFLISGNVLLYCWCVWYYSFEFLMRLSESVSFSVYINIF